jgi:hypothetical protein
MFAVDRNRFEFPLRVSLAEIDSVVSARLGTTRVTGNAQPAAFNRQIAMYLAKHVGGWSTTAIGRFYNGRDHSTVCYALKRVEALRENDPEVDGLLSALAVEIKTAEPKDNGRTGTERQRLADAKDLPLNDAFLDALADRLAVRILGRGRGIDASGAFGPKSSKGESDCEGNPNKDDDGKSLLGFFG